MSGLLLVLPDFLVILLGVFLRARFFTESTFWLRTEKLVFYPTCRKAPPFTAGI